MPQINLSVISPNISTNQNIFLRKNSIEPVYPKLNHSIESINNTNNNIELLHSYGINTQDITNNLERKDIKNKIKNEIKKVAIYGFEDYQSNCLNYMHGIIKNQNTITIASLNHVINLIKLNSETFFTSFSSLNQQLDCFIKALDNKAEINPNMLPQEYNLLLEKWQYTLSNNKNKIDIFSYLASKDNTLAQQKTLKNLITKNTSNPKNTNFLLEFIDKKVLPCQSLADFRKKLPKLYRNNPIECQLHLSGLFELIENHFFRNTSKLGLDFFKENDYSIVMAWNKNKEKALSLEYINKKDFKHGFRRLFNNKEHIEPITFSEIRHLDRNKNIFSDKAIRLLLTKESAAFSLGIEGKWAEYSDIEFLNSKI